IVGATLLTVRLKVVVAVWPAVSVALIVTGTGPAGPSGGVYDQFQTPVVVSLVTVPREAVSVTVARPLGSSNVPVFVIWEPSLPVTAAWSEAMSRTVVLSTTLTALSPKLLATKSGLPSPFTSPMATDLVAVPVSTRLLGKKEP